MRWRASFRVLCACLVLSFIFVHGKADREPEEDTVPDEASTPKPQQTSFAARIVTGIVSTSVGLGMSFLILVPAELVLQSPRYLEVRQEGDYVDLYALWQAGKWVLTQLEDPALLTFVREELLMFGPRLCVKLLTAGILRGPGAGNPILGLFAGAGAGLAVALYSYPFRICHEDRAFENADYETMVRYLINFAQVNGVRSLYDGFLDYFIQIVAFNAIMFSTMEILSMVLVKNIITVVVAAAISVLTASMFSPTVRQLIRIVAHDPLDWRSLIFGPDYKHGGARELTFNMQLLQNYAYFVWVSFWDNPIYGVMQMTPHIFALLTGLAFQHLLLVKGG